MILVIPSDGAAAGPTVVKMGLPVPSSSKSLLADFVPFLNVLAYNNDSQLFAR
jgi:hypothetical protein